MGPKAIRRLNGDVDLALGLHEADDLVMTATRQALTPEMVKGNRITSGRKIGLASTPIFAGGKSTNTFWLRHSVPA
jgi:hypothetical protein